MQLESPAIRPNAPIPVRYTCEGDDVSPPLSWRDVPDGTKSLALVIDDPDAPDPKHPQRTFVHWVVYNLPPDATALPEDARGQKLPSGARTGKNDFQRTEYGGPCPPIGRHRYFHKLYALDTVLGELGTPSKAELLRALDGHVIGQAELVGTYEKGVSG